jgi:hypothetical protein
MLSVVMLSVVMLSVVMLSVVSPITGGQNVDVVHNIDNIRYLWQI